MAEEIDHDRRRFLGRAAMTMAAAQLGMFGTTQANNREPRELAAIGRATEWLNSPRLTPSSLAGKVVLVDFCTYTCINWLRTLPYVRAWAQKYRQGLVVIGVHTPEFAFEQNVDNVRRAVQQMRIDYPIVIDNDYAIWRAFKNQYWPALYFVDARGRVREHHFGEGEYRTVGEGHSTVAGGSGRRRHWRGRRVGRCQRRRSAGGLGQPEIAGELRRLRAHARTSRRLAVPSWTGVASMLPLAAWRSINGRWLASGRWAGRRPS